MDRQFRSLGDLARHFRAVAAALPAAEERMLGLAGAAVQRIARDKLGKYQPGWAPLAASTLADKQRHGFPVPSPELRTGAMGDSLSVTVAPPQVIVWSADPVYHWQEFGTSRMPARPSLGPAMIEAQPEIDAVAVGLIAETFRSAP